MISEDHALKLLCAMLAALGCLLHTTFRSPMGGTTLEPLKNQNSAEGRGLYTVRSHI